MAVSAFSQRDIRKADRSFISLRTNPFSFAEVDANAMLGAGIQWSPRWAVSIEPAYIYARQFQENANMQRIRSRGIKFRMDLRYYLNDYDPLGRKMGVFIAPEFHYKKVKSAIWADFGINCVNGSCSFTQRALYTELKKETGGLFKLGINIPRIITPRLGIELFGGLGFKFRHYRETDLPPGGSFITPPRTTNVFVQEDGALPMLPGGVKFSFLLK